MPIYFVWFTTALLSVGGDTSNQNLPQSGRLLYCVIIPVRNIHPKPSQFSDIRVRVRRGNPAVALCLKLGGFYGSYPSEVYRYRTLFRQFGDGEKILHRDVGP